MAIGDDCLIRTAMLAYLACGRGGRVTDAPNVLMSSVLSKMSAVLLEQVRVHPMPRGLQGNLVTHMTGQIPG